jgi:hypothetical protein
MPGRPLGSRMDLGCPTRSGSANAQQQTDRRESCAATARGARIDPAQTVVHGKAEDGVTWLHCYVNPDRLASYCVYDGPSPEANRVGAGATYRYERSRRSGEQEGTPMALDETPPAVARETCAASVDMGERALSRRMTPVASRYDGEGLPGAAGRVGGRVRRARWRLDGAALAHIGGCAVAVGRRLRCRFRLWQVPVGVDDAAIVRPGALMSSRSAPVGGSAATRSETAM